ncbi:MAG: EAL domain-containing protein [Janthinobacterium lividum]
MAHHYDFNLVLVSLLISVLASWMALELSCRVHARQGRASRWYWLAAGSLVMGTGIWAMHYIGMLAYRVDMRVAYHWPTVLLSFMSAVLASGCALYLVTSKDLTWPRSLTGGFVMGSGIASMHYIGMSAMRMPCTAEYHAGLVTLSVLLAMVISSIAIRICYSFRTEADSWSGKRIGASLLMGSAIPTMHYLGMAAVRMSEASETAVPVNYHNTVQISQLSTLGISVGVILFLAFAMCGAVLDRRFMRFHSQIKKSEDDHNLLNSYQQRLMSAYRRQGVGCWSCDPKTMLFHVDPSLRPMYDMEDNNLPIPREEWLRRVHADDLHLLSERWQKALAGGGHYDNEYRVVHRDGSILHCRTVAVIERDTDGEPTHVEGMTWDVTLERREQKEAIEQAERFHMTLEAIGEGVLSVDQEHRILYANPVACQLVGWTAAESLNRPLMEVFRTVDEQTGLPRTNPVQRCIEQGGMLLSEVGILLSRDGTKRNIRKHVNLVGSQGSAVITFQDVTAARRLQLDLITAATHDALTGLPNRSAFDKHLKKVLQDSLEGSTHCLALLDLDRFKVINDTSGHVAGDAFLKQVVAALKSAIRAGDYIARMGGDEFLLLLQNTDVEEAESLSYRLLHAIESLRFTWEHRAYSATASIGLVSFDRTPESLETLVSHADVAMYTAKRKGRNQLTVYCGSDGEAAGNLQEMEIVAGLQSALDENRFELHAQPIVPASGKEAVPYFELLIRMKDAAGGLIPPSTFIPAAESYGMMQAIDRWVIRHALAAYAPVFRAGRTMRFAINVSAESLSDPTLWAFVQEEFQASGVPPSAITFEVTESGIIQNVNTAANFLQQAKLAGSRVALDDFGTGMSSLSYLKQFPLDVIKIDGSFVKKLRSTPLDQTIVEAIAKIARAMGASTVAECTEDMETVSLVAMLGVDYVQGWATGKPKPLATVLAVVQPKLHLVETQVA